MSKKMEDVSVIAAADRFFRSYFKHSVEPDLDTLFSYLNALHSFNDRLRKKEKGDLFGSAEFMALKALRNLFHHETEFAHKVLIIPAHELPAISVELMTVCLANRELIDRAVQREKRGDWDRIIGAFRWYGPVVDIQPCVFNAAVDVYETSAAAGIELSSDEYAQFAESYEYEEKNGIEHRVKGSIVCHAGNIDQVLAGSFKKAVS